MRGKRSLEVEEKIMVRDNSFYSFNLYSFFLRHILSRVNELSSNNQNELLVFSFFYFRRVYVNSSCVRFLEYILGFTGI